jgi:hypothetical protein
MTDPAHRRGIVMIITLLAIVLLVALILFVLNLGQQVNRRIAVQDTADATAIAGSTWVARTLNTVAKNNVSISRYIALVTVLDAFPQSNTYALTEQQAIREALDAQLDRGVTVDSTALVGELTTILEAYRDELDAEIDQLNNAESVFDNYDVRQATHYEAPNGERGLLWQAMAAMDELNQAAMEHVGPIAQRIAVDGADAANAEQAVGMLIPVSPTIPWERGQFNDFERPVLNGILPAAIDDTFERRGPYDALFGWRGLVSRRVGATFVPGQSQPATPGSRGGVPIGSGAGGGGSGGGRWVGGETIVTGYYTWGMHSHLLRRVSSFVGNHLRNTRLNHWVNGLARAKLSYLWNVSDDVEGAAADPGQAELSTVVNPEWIIDYDEARNIGRNDPGRVRNTAFIAVEIKSRYPRRHPSFLSEGSWRLIDENGRQPRLVRLGGWVDPQGWGAAPTVTKVVSHGWRDEWEYEVWHDYQIGIEPLVDGATGEPITQPAYRIDHFYFVGINVGESEDIRNPFTGFNPYASNAPAPINLDHSRVNRTDDARRQYLTYLAAARRHDHAQAWPSRFAGDKPSGNIVAIAQAKVFNNHSWDLWTAMWHAKLEPVTRYDDWMTRLADSAEQAGPIEGVNAQTFEEMEKYLLSTSGLAEALLE